MGQHAVVPGEVADRQQIEARFGLSVRVEGDPALISPEYRIERFKTASRIDVPRSLARLAPGTIVAGCSAWAQRRGIARVDVRLDDGDWTPAELGAEATVDTWRQWKAEFPDVGSGLHAITVRAVDKDGTVQTAERRESIPNSATGHHRIQFTVD